MNTVRKIAIRVDSSFSIGTGHVMRMLTLADALVRTGRFEPVFLVRELPGNVNSKIRDCGFTVRTLGHSGHLLEVQAAGGSEYQSWLGADPQDDVNEVNHWLAQEKADLICVDHYAIDAEWEAGLILNESQIIVVDDLANRSHRCALLVDGNLGRTANDYRLLVAADTQLLIGAEYALLRPEFTNLRQRSLDRKVQTDSYNILVSLGGVDQRNATSKVVSTLARCWNPSFNLLTVIVGKQFSGFRELTPAIDQFPGKVDLRIDVKNIADYMVAADLAIGAAGVSAWERCVLGLPSLLVILANNQRNGAMALVQKGAALLVGGESDIESRLVPCLAKALFHDNLSKLRAASMNVTEGKGVDRFIAALDALP